MILSQLINNKGIVENIVVFSCIMFPSILLIINLSGEIFEKVFNIYLKFINIISIILITTAIFDKVTGYGIARFLANIFNDRYFYDAVYYNNSIGRFYSFMGHPLYNAQIFLMFYIVNFFAKKYFKTGLNMIVVSIITMLGVLFTASKTAFVLLLICLIFFRPIKNKFIYVIFIILAIYFSINLGLFDPLIYRLKTQTLTSGRNEVWNIITQMNIFPIKWFSGYGSGFNNLYNNYVTLASAAFEYPIRLFSLEYGRIFTIGLYTLICVYPILKILLRKNILILLGFAIIFLDVNTYNAIGLGSDNMLMFITFTYICINLSEYIFTKKNKSVNKSS
ncbi:hypothetical protein KCK38_001926 [Clostridium perfringens]|nr:hypothetical protein [Clostridium perfringens]